MATPAGTPAPAATLEVASSDGASFIHRLNDAKCVIGRHPKSDLQLADREVSKDHLAIEPEGDGHRVRDLGSSNGTFVNGERLAKQTRLLEDGDEIRVGTTKMTYRQMLRRQTGNLTVVEGGRMLTSVLATVKGDEANQFRAASVIKNDELLRQDYEKLRVALEFQNKVGADISVESLLSRLLDFALDVLKADNGAVLLKGADGKLEVNLVRQRTKSDEEVAVSATVLKRVMETREGVLSADAVMDHRFVASKSIVAHGIRAAMAVPMVAKGEVLGVIFLDTRERTGAFTEKDLRILAALGAQAASMLETTLLRIQLQNEELKRQNLSRFLPAVLVDQVAKGEVKLADEGEQRQITVLFADIRGFTSLSETQEAEVVVRMLKGYFELMSQSVFGHRGMVDKFIGDAVMAIWGAPEQIDDAPLRACLSAQEMQSRLAMYNARRLEAGEPSIGVGIGINSGAAVVGLMGSSQRPEYTAIGDTVNVASRLCGLAKAGQIIVSASTAKKLGNKLVLNALPDAQVKGRAQKVQLFEVQQRMDSTKTGV